MKGKILNVLLYAQKLAELIKSSVDTALKFLNNYIKS